MTMSTSPTSVGSRADVGSSNRRTLGSIVSARAIATRCFWPPDRRAGYSSRFSDRPTLSRYFSAVAMASSRGRPFTRIGASMRLSMTRMCGNRLNSWNTIWAPQPDLADLLAVRPAARVERVGVDPDPADLDRAHRRLLEEVGAPQERALARAGLADEADRLARVDLERAAAQDVVGAEELLEAEDLHDRPRARPA